MSVTEEARAWRVGPFRWLWGASALSVLGTELGDLVLPLLALLALDAGPGDLAALRVAQFAPFLLFTLVLGVLVDRLNRRRLLIGADLGRGLLLLLVGVLALVGGLPVPLLIAVAGVVGTLAVLYQLADFSVLPQLVPPPALADANAKLSATASMTSLAGNGVGGLLVQALTAPVAVLVDAVAYLGSALLLTRVPYPADPPPGPDGGAFAQARAGLAFLLRHRVLRALAGEAGTWNLGHEILLLGLTLHVVATFPYGAASLGLLLMLAGVGGFAGAWVSGHATRRFGYGRSLVATMLIGNSAPLLLALDADSTVLYATALTISGFGIGLANAQAVTVRQLVTPDPLRGRVNAAYRLISWGMVAVGAAVAGLVATHWGPFTAIVVGAVGCATATLWVALTPVRTLRTLDDSRTVTM